MNAVRGQIWQVAPRPQVAAPLRAVHVWHRDSCPDTDIDGVELRATVRLTVDGEDPNLRGHFPDLAVYPGIFVIETLCQAMALIVESPGVPVLRRIESVRFVAPLLDGDTLTLAVVAVPDGDGWLVTGIGTRQDGGVTARIRARFDRADRHDD